MSELQVGSITLEGLKYRRDIDGLRCIAVASVILFHAKFPFTSGGFVGVDIFFVISGYLITSILQNDITKERFSLWRFYDRRIRRILPAYALVAIATTVAAWLILPPNEMANYGRRLASTALFYSNYYFLSETSYFAPSSEENPLLHTWSLSVEEQFYIAWPLIMFVLAMPLFTRHRKALIITAFTLSFALASYAAIILSPAAFYASPLRAWELLLGCMLALGFVPHFKAKTNEWIAGVGLILILVPIHFYVSKVTIFPGLTALPPCLGTAMIIAAGRRAPTKVSALLSLRPIVFIGLLSYSLYLWHWPVFVFSRIYLARALTPAETSTAILAIGLISYVSWRFIEGPFRKSSSDLPAQYRSVAVAVSFLGILFLSGIVTNLNHGWPQRASSATLTAEQERALPARGPRGCIVKGPDAVFPKSHGCLLGYGTEEDASVVLVGDSHAGSYSEAINAVGNSLHFGALLWAKSSCHPNAEPLADPSWYSNRREQACRVFMKNIVHMLADKPEIKTVILAGFWSSSVDKDEDPVENLVPSDREAFNQLSTDMNRIVEALTSMGKSVILLGQTSVNPNGGGDCVIRQRFLGRDDRTICRSTRAYNQALIGPSDDVLSEIARKHPNVYFYSGMHAFCDAEYCNADFDGHIVNRDEHHLSALASRHLAKEIEVVFREAGF
tara:strand:- start:5998 stop:8016 length:2019 start_codon:yes stop_codon:yes gene_type:complete